ncbi:PP2C family protein-serine/threonine phosphatase [Cellulomonas citrea]|uniref:PP2C family protein-serine/threonine phosphatase n=1 Tax=Cellulomonas citrea TaxID=1909423 RepID=UPI00135896A0|nr:PP2C family serine/threonine-protein phosphatase [Cellulomonas citrea]
MTVALRYAARSDVGLVRANNQDSAYAGPHLLAIADGMGGHAGGDVASSVTIAELAPLDEEAHGPDDALAELEAALVEAKAEIVRRTRADPTLSGMGTTVTAILRTENKLAMVHLGDSRGYLLRDGELTQVTTDHTFVQHLVDTGRITPEEAIHHPQRSVVMRVLGDFDLDLTPDLSVREARVGDRWLLCSDGLSGFVSADTLTETLRTQHDVDECADRLVQLALRAGGGDNVTVVVADVVDLDSRTDLPSTEPQVVGAAATSRNRPTSAADGPAARARALLAPEAQAADEAEHEQDDEHPQPSRRRALVAVWLAAVAVVLAVAGGGYAWTQTQYFVGVDDGRVAISRGVPATAGPISLSHVVERSDVRAADLPPYLRERVQKTIAADSLADARSLVTHLDDATGNPLPTGAPSSFATPSSSGLAPLPSVTGTPAPGVGAPSVPPVGQ